ncbi:uncharacterized protein LOC132607854 [Lycium barbarum]|uniref:uncharacterized protein LOC132607854 n=1 Tax=Lycium barbarum TaxID=112863 RepID=UPI00293E9179|nr:uncharacterized protein LOC132607854 [Lycium barbarum]
MANQGGQEARTLGETTEMLRDKVLQIEKHLQEIGKKIEEVDGLLDPPEGTEPQEKSPKLFEEEEPEKEEEPKEEEKEQEEEEEEPLDMKEIGPVDIGVEIGDNTFEMFPKFQGNNADDESGYYAPH